MINHKKFIIYYYYIYIFINFNIICDDTLKQKLSPINDNKLIDLDPDTQNIPLPPYDINLRPPPAMKPEGNEFEIFVGISSFRDSFRCGKTIFTGLKRAKFPNRIRFGVVDQLSFAHNESTCMNEYCKLAMNEWTNEKCKYKNQITEDIRDAKNSRGPTLARHYQQKLIKNEEFCLQLDGHSIFTNSWDIYLVEDWLSINNEMAVLSTYIHHIHNFVNEKTGENTHPSQLPHLCKTMRGTDSLVRNEGASMIVNPQKPQMSALWGAGLSFSKCHAEKRVLIDPYTLWMFDGEEFLRSSHLFTYGYDMYSPSKKGSVIYHNYTSVPARFENVDVDEKIKTIEREYGQNRFWFKTKVPFKGLVDTHDMDLYRYGNVRTFEEYLQFSGINLYNYNKDNKKDNHTCYQLHWQPYSNPTEIENLLGNWKYNDTSNNDSDNQDDDKSIHSFDNENSLNTNDTIKPKEYNIRAIKSYDENVINNRKSIQRKEDYDRNKNNNGMILFLIGIFGFGIFLLLLYRKDILVKSKYYKTRNSSLTE